MLPPWINVILVTNVNLCIKMQHLWKKKRTVCCPNIKREAVNNQTSKKKWKIWGVAQSGFASGHSYAKRRNKRTLNCAARARKPRHWDRGLWVHRSYLYGSNKERNELQEPFCGELRVILYIYCIGNENSVHRAEITFNNA